LSCRRSFMAPDSQCKWLDVDVIGQHQNPESKIRGAMIGVRVCCEIYLISPRIAWSSFDLRALRDKTSTLRASVVFVTWMVWFCRYIDSMSGRIARAQCSTSDQRRAVFKLRRFGPRHRHWFPLPLSPSSLPIMHIMSCLHLAVRSHPLPKPACHHYSSLTL